MQIAPKDTVGQLKHRVSYVDDSTSGLVFHNLPSGLESCSTGWQDLQAIELASVESAFLANFGDADAFVARIGGILLAFECPPSCNHS